jgi:hypothetical protein
MVSLLWRSRAASIHCGTDRADPGGLSGGFLTNLLASRPAAPDREQATLARATMSEQARRTAYAQATSPV